MKIILAAAFLLCAPLAHAETAKGYFNDKGEIVYTYKDGKPVGNRKPADFVGDSSTIDFQDDGTNRCYHLGSALSCIPKPATPVSHF